MKEPLPILIIIALIIIAIAAVLIMTWELEPWWRKFPTPRRQIDDAKDRVRLYRIQHRHPEVFGLETRRRRLMKLVRLNKKE